MTDTSGVRTTDQSVAGHRRLVYDSVIAGLRLVFGSTYDRDPQFRGRNGQGLKITQQYPLEENDYPCIVLQYQPTDVENAGVGHYEIFPDRQGVLRKWNHNHFKGRLNLMVYALSTPDRDILSDALVELIRFGRLDESLNVFFETIYPRSFHPNNEVFMFPDDDYIALTQLALNSDQVQFTGDSASPAPWSPEDTLLYAADHSLEIHGGYYNVLPTPELIFWTAYEIMAQMENDEGDTVNPLPEFASGGWNPPKWYEDGAIVGGVATISGEEA